MLTVFRFHSGTLGAYNEVALDLACAWHGEPRFYTVYNLVDNDAGIAAGREIWGVPKKSPGFGAPSSGFPTMRCSL